MTHGVGDAQRRHIRHSDSDNSTNCDSDLEFFVLILVAKSKEVVDVLIQMPKTHLAFLFISETSIVEPRMTDK